MGDKRKDNWKGKKNPNFGGKRQIGKNNPRWKGGIVKLRGGYIGEYCPNHPFCWGKGYVLQHRLVMEKYIKRFLLPKEIVHHINGISSDNRIENLQLLSCLGEHNSIHKRKQDD